MTALGLLDQGDLDVPPSAPRGNRAALGRASGRRPRPALGDWLTVLAVAALVLAVVAALFPGVFTSGDPLAGNVADKFQPPSRAHWFGTDEIGRDVYTRVVHGAHLTLQSVLLAVLIAFVAGSAIGVTAGFVRGWVDEALMRVVDVLLAVPGLLLSLAVVTAIGSGVWQIAVAVGVASVASFARITRAEVVSVRASDYVEAAAGSGSGRLAVLARHVLPNAIGPAVALSTLELGMAVLSVASLSFLGFGAPAPQPEWGRLVATGRDYLASGWWLAIIPSLIIAVIIISTNIVSRFLDRWVGRRAL
ncbi:ABC transporter permease [Mycobacterium sp. C31M]